MNIQKIKLYHYPLTRSSRVRWLLHEILDDDFELEIVNIYGGQLYDKKFILINPFHSVPLLEIEEKNGELIHMIESGAIVTFLADIYSEKKLAPHPILEFKKRMDYLQMLHFCSTMMDMALWQIRMNLHILPKNERNETIVKRYENKFSTEIEPFISNRLENHKYICGNEFCAVDCIFGHNVMWARSYGLFNSSVIKSYLSNISKRPSFVKAFSDFKDFNAYVPKESILAKNFTG